MPASDRTSPNPGARLHPHVPRGPGGLKTFALMIDPKKLLEKKPHNSNSIAMNPKPSSKADILCSGWWKRLWRLAVNGRRPTEPTHSGGQIGLLVANAQQGLQTWCSGATPFSKSKMTPYMDISRLVAYYLFSPNISTGSFQRSTAQLFWRTNSWKISSCNLRWHLLNSKNSECWGGEPTKKATPAG